MPKRILVGKVISNKMDKTGVLSVERKPSHPLYGKFVKKTKKYKFHDEENICSIGDIVKIIECRPLSKHKRWRLLEKVKKTDSNVVKNIKE